MKPHVLGQIYHELTGMCVWLALILVHGELASVSLSLVGWYVNNVSHGLFCRSMCVYVCIYRMSQIRVGGAGHCVCAVYVYERET